MKNHPISTVFSEVLKTTKFKNEVSKRVALLHMRLMYVHTFCTSERLVLTVARWNGPLDSSRALRKGWASGFV